MTLMTLLTLLALMTLALDLPTCSLRNSNCLRRGPYGFNKGVHRGPYAQRGGVVGWRVEREREEEEEEKERKREEDTERMR